MRNRDCSRSKVLIFCIFGVFLSPCIQSAAAQDSRLSLKGVDVYGTDDLDSGAIRLEFKSALEQLVKATSVRDLKESTRIREEIGFELAHRGDFAYLEVSSIRYYPPRSGLYITIDVVERRHANRRMPFREEPAYATFEDPDGLLAKWHEYSQVFFSLAQAGHVEPGECEVLHCLASFEKNADLSPYLTIFNEGASEHEDLLYEIALKHLNPYGRARAVFLLAHTRDVDRVMSLLGSAMFDPSSLVRNNAMRVMIMLAEKDPDLPLPTEHVIAAMDFPATVDRNKAVFVVASLAKSPKHRDTIRRLAVPTALRLLRLEQPNNHNGAYELLTTLSGQEFGPRNYDAWIEWANNHSLLEQDEVVLPLDHLAAPGGD